MTDEQFVKVLAEREGWIVWEETRGINKAVWHVLLRDPAPWTRYRNAEEEKGRYRRLAWSEFDRNRCINFDRIPPYLTSLDALAGVLGRLSDEEWMKLTNSLLKHPTRPAMPTLWDEWKWLLTLPPRVLAEVVAVLRGEE